MVVALRSPTGASRWLLTAALQKSITILLSVPLMLEHLAVAGLSAREMNAILDAVSGVGMHVGLSFRWRPLLTDANDDMVLETAINGGARLLVTFNVRDFGDVGEPFGCRAVLPREAVQFVRTTK